MPQDAEHVAVTGVPAAADVLARKPKVVLAPAGTVPFHPALRTVVPVSAPFQTWVIRLPVGSTSVTAHEEIAAVDEVLVTVTSPW